MTGYQFSIGNAVSISVPSSSSSCFKLSKQPGNTSTVSSQSTYTAYDEIAEVLSTAEPAKLAKLRASAEIQTRLESLIEKSKAGELSKSEKDELDHYIVLERLIRLAKTRARAENK